MRAFAGWHITLLDGPTPGGTALTGAGEDSCLVNRNFNDRNSGMRVTRLTPAPTAPISSEGVI